MIVSKPKPKALLALGIFILITFSMGSYAINSIVKGNDLWFHYLIAGLTMPIALLLFIRQLASYKVVSLGESKLQVKYPFRRSKKLLPLTEIIEWKEETITTKNDPYRRLEVKFESYILKLTVQENTQYEQILKYLKKRVSKKETK